LKEVSRIFHRLSTAMDIGLGPRPVETLRGSAQPIGAAQLQHLTSLAHALLALTEGLHT
jgi:hypothetical protein